MARQIVIDIIGDATKFTKATQQATGSAEKFGALFGSGFGLGAGIGMWNLAGDAVQKVTGYLVDSVAQAKEEEVGIARMGAALTANVESWDGNTDAIERRIDAMVRTTGFSDGEMRDSLARLVAATKDSGKAFDIQATAMDLARFKGISLAEASDALIKVEAGQYRALKSLGIVLEKGATQTEALAAVQKVAGGQMSAYMDTAAGKSEVLSNRLGDLQEEVGSRLTPALTTATERVLGLMDAFDSEADLTFADRAFSISQILNDLNPAVLSSNVLFGEFSKQQAIAAEAAGKAAGEAARSWDTGSERIGVALGNVATASETTTEKVKRDNRQLVTSYSDIADYLLGAYNESFDSAMSIQEARSDLHNAKTDEDRADAYAQLAEYGALSQKDYDNWLAALERMSATTKSKIKADIDAAIVYVEHLRTATSRPITIDVGVNYRTSGEPKGIGGRASGGPASGLTLVGEKGAELVDLPNGSYVYDANTSRRMLRILEILKRAQQTTKPPKPLPQAVSPFAGHNNAMEALDDIEGARSKGTFGRSEWDMHYPDSGTGEWAGYGATTDPMFPAKHKGTQGTGAAPLRFADLMGETKPPVTINATVNVTGPVLDPYGDFAQRLAASLIPGLQRELGRQGINL